MHRETEVIYITNHVTIIYENQKWEPEIHSKENRKQNKTKTYIMRTFQDHQ